MAGGSGNLMCVSDNMSGSKDTEFMDLALGLARRALGNCWPNPAVGAVIVGAGDQSERVLGRGWTQPGGRPHAETHALGHVRRLGLEAAAGGTAYVTLEPCNHHGQTPPCTEALLAAGLGRVVVAVRDPDKRVAGTGLQRLADAGVAVSVGAGAERARALNAGYFMRQAVGRPMVTWKTATSLDGRIAAGTGDSRWITGAAARARGHLLRAQHDAIMVGAETATRDDPALDCRLPGLGQRTPVRIVVDSRLRLPLTSKLVQTARESATWVLTSTTAERQRVEALRAVGVEVLAISTNGEGLVDLDRAMTALGERGLTRVLVEGGAHLAASLLRAALVDEIAWFRAPNVLGGDGIPATAALGIDRVANARGFTRRGDVQLGDDVLETYVREVAE